MTPTRLCLFLVVSGALVAAGRSAPQAAPAPNNPNRPPWAQKSKKNSKGSGTSASAPVGEPGKIVQPIPPNDPPESQSSTPQRGGIKVTVNLVNVLASVLDENNRPVPDLPAEEFQIFEEGVQQKVEVFESETTQPLDLALMIDASLSAHKEITFEQDAAARFIGQILRPVDRLSVFCFDEDVTQLAPYTEKVSTLQAAVRKVPPGAGTSIYDAIALGARSLENRGEDRRRVIILVTDAGETTSHTDFDAARKAAVKSGALLYTIVIRPIKTESGRNTAGEHALETMTDTTGGAMFYPDSAHELNSIFDRIDRELRTQYRLGYYPNPRGPANTYRSIQIKVGDHYHARHRKTYLTGPQ